MTFLSLTLVTKKHGFSPGTCETEGGCAARPPNPGLCLNRNSTFWYSLLKLASNLVLKLITAVMQIALVLSDKMKSLSVITMFSEYSFGISNLVLKFLQMVGSTSSRSNSSLFISLIVLSFLIIKLLVRVSPTPTLQTKKFIDVAADGAGLKLSGGMYNGRSVAVQPNNEFLSSRCFPADLSTCWMLCVSVFFSSACRSCIYSRILKFLLSLFFLSRFVQDLLLFPVRCSPPATSAYCR